MRKTIIIVSLVLAGCATQYDMTPRPHALPSDSAWLRDADAALIRNQVAGQARFTGRIEAQIALKRQLDCQRGVWMSQFRAAEVKAQRSGMSAKSAIDEVRADPTWIIAMNSCR